ELHETAQLIQTKTGVDVLPVVCDLTKGNDIENLVTSTLEQFSRIDILVTNLPHPSEGGLFTLTDDDWQYGFESMLLPVIRLYRLVVPIMQQQQWGRIVNITSLVVKEPSLSYLTSGVFRTGIVSLSKSIARLYGGDGIRINTLCPGLFRTPLGEAIIHNKAEQEGTSLDDAESAIASLTATKQIGEPEELAGLVTFLCSDIANHITGQVIGIEGGKLRGLF
ncbi:MAG: SDR family oxidoreductase, partial [Chloroflexota bacterium]